MFLALCVFGILVLSYSVILFGSSSFAPGISFLQRGIYLAVALALTACVFWVGCAAAGREAHQVLWQPSTALQLLITFDSNKFGGMYRVHDWAPLWCLIPLFLSVAAGLGMRHHLGKHAGKILVPMEAHRSLARPDETPCT